MPICEMCQREFKSGNSLRVHRSRFHRAEITSSSPQIAVSSDPNSQKASASKTVAAIGDVVNSVEEHTNKLKEQSDAISQVAKQVSELDKKLVIHDREEESSRKESQEFKNSLLSEFRSAQIAARLDSNPDLMKQSPYAMIPPPPFSPPDPSKVIKDLAQSSGINFAENNSLIPRPTEIAGLFRPSTFSKTMRKQLGLE